MIDDEETNKEMRENIKTQLRQPERRNVDHIKATEIRSITFNIRQLHIKLVKGYSFDKSDLEQLVSQMFSFINGIVDPDASKDKTSEVVTDEIVK
jgi:hypothetical protein